MKFINLIVLFFTAAVVNSQVFQCGIINVRDATGGAGLLGDGSTTYPEVIQASIGFLEEGSGREYKDPLNKRIGNTILNNTTAVPSLNTWNSYTQVGDPGKSIVKDSGVAD